MKWTYSAFGALCRPKVTGSTVKDWVDGRLPTKCR